jgi:RimJ/RimL family protein N-acetyltransferase
MADFELQPTLTGELLTLRPLRLEDWDDLFAVASDPLIWAQHPERERYREEVFRKFFQGALDSNGAFVAIDNATGKMIGSSRYYGYSAEESKIEIGWSFLARAYWGGKYNGEMKRLMLTHAFRFVDAVVFVVGPDNIRSQRAVEKIGGTRIGTRPNDRGDESVVYRLRRAEYG